jgi:hypothetical protein
MASAEPTPTPAASPELAREAEGDDDDLEPIEADPEDEEAAKPSEVARMDTEEKLTLLHSLTAERKDSPAKPCVARAPPDRRVR